MEPKYIRYMGYWGVAISITLGVVFACKSFPAILELFKSNLLEGVLQVLVLISIICWFLIYLFTARSELEIINTYVRSSTPDSVKYSEFFMIAALAIGYGVLLCSINQLLLLTITIAGLQAIDLLADSMVLNKVVNSYQKDIASGECSSEKQIIYDYYLHHQAVRKDFFMFLAFSCSFVIAFWHHYELEPLLKYVSMSIIPLAILFGELTHYHWRQKRDVKLSKLKEAPQQ